MGRNLMIIVSDDGEFTDSARSLCEAQGGTVKVYSTTEWTRQAGEPGFAQTLTGERPMTSQKNEGAKILPFPGMPAGQTASAEVVEKKVEVAEPVVLPAPAQMKTMEELEIEALQSAIAKFNGNLTEAARALGIGRATLYRKVKQYGLDPNEARKRRFAA